VAFKAILQGADIELIMVVVNKKAWFHTVNTKALGRLADNYKIL
jgi:hypothetical protein